MECQNQRKETCYGTWEQADRRKLNVESCLARSVFIQWFGIQNYENSVNIPEIPTAEVSLKLL